MEKQDAVSEEIVIVGSRHGELADIVKPIYEKGDPVENESIEGLLGLDRVILWPSDEDFDKYGVRVLTEDLRPIGHVWMCQSPAVLQWLKDRERKYLKARITRICVKAGVLMAKSESPLALSETERCVAKMDRGWAADLPEVLKSLTEQSLGLGLRLLRDELEESEQWSPRLEMRIDNLLKSLPLDLSGHHYRDCIDLYKTMMASEDAEVRMHGELVLKSVVHRGSPDQMQWWVENWLPDFLRMAADGDLLMVERTSHFNNQDIVAARVNGQDVLKSYYMDEHGRHWLVPSNDRYDAILLTEDMDVRFVGRMVWNMQRNVHDTTRNIRESIERFLNKNGETLAKPQMRLTREEVARALVAVGPLVTKGRHWLGPCRVLMDRDYVPKNRYDLFCELVASVLPDHLHLPMEAELRRMAVDCFSKPFKTWTDERAPVHRQYYQGYYEAGAAMVRQLP